MPQETRYTLESIRVQEHESLKQKSIQKMNELERNMEIMSCEYDKIKAQIKAKNQEVDAWKIKYSKLEVKYNNELQKQELQQDDDKDDLENKIQMLISEIERLNAVVQQKNDEIDKFRRLLEQTAQQIPLF